MYSYDHVYPHVYMLYISVRTHTHMHDNVCILYVHRLCVSLCVVCHLFASARLHELVLQECIFAMSEL